VARVTELAGPWEAVNTAANPAAIVPQESDWRHNLQDGQTRRVFPARSVTVLRFE
jgi:hypothetical protein